MALTKTSPEDIEALLQEICSLKLKNNSLENTFAFVKDEYEVLLKEKDNAEKLFRDEKAAYCSKIQKLEGKLVQLGESFDIYKEESEKEKLCKEENVKPVSLVKDTNTDEVNVLSMQAEEYMTEIESLKAQLEVYKRNEAEDKSKIKRLESENNCLTLELEEHKRMLETKTQQLQEITASFEELKEEKLLLSSELATLKSVPANVGTRGNSLFGEVEDRRQAMSSKLKILYNKYLTLKKNYNWKIKDYDYLKADLALLQSKWSSIKDEEPKADQRLIAAQNNRIKYLMDRVSELEKRPEEPNFVVLDDKNVTWALTFIEKARNEKAKLQDELDRYSLNQYAVEELNRSKSSEILSLKKENMELKMEISKLKINNETGKDGDSTASIINTEGNEENIPTIMSKGRKIRFNDQ